MRAGIAVSAANRRCHGNGRDAESWPAREKPGGGGRGFESSGERDINRTAKEANKPAASGANLAETPIG